MIYDANTLKAIDVTSGEFASEFVFSHRISPGEVQVSFAGPTPLSGTGTLANIEFQVADSAVKDDISLLALTGVQFNERAVLPLTVIGEFTVTQGIVLRGDEAQPAVTTDIQVIELKPGETSQVSFRIRNVGRNLSSTGFFSPSVSSGLEIVAANGVQIDPIVMELKELGGLELSNFPPGTTIYSADGQQISAENQLLDVVRAYESGAEQTITLTIRAKENATGPQWIRYRAAMFLPDDSLVSDPLPGTGDAVNQQGHDVYVIPVQISFRETEEDLPSPAGQETVKLTDDQGRTTELIVRATDFTLTVDGGLTASENITINNFLAVDGNITIAKNRERLVGSGTVKMLDVPFAGEVPLFRSNTFEINSTDIDLVNLAGVEMKLSIGHLAVELKSFKILDDGVEIDGEISLPKDVHIVGGGSKVDANLSITKSRGIELLGGEIHVKKVALGHTGFRLEDVHLLYRQEDNLFEGGCQVAIPRLFAIEGRLGIRDGKLNKVGIGVDELNKPIIYTPTVPPVPIVFLQRIFGELDQLAPGPPPVIFTAETAFSLGPQIQGNYIVRAELGITVDTSGELSGTGTLKVFNESAVVAATLRLNREKGIFIEGDLNILDIVEASGEATLDWQNNFKGKFLGVIKTPEDWLLIGGNEFGETKIYADNTKFAAGVRFAFMDVGIVYDSDGFDFPANLHKITEISFNRIPHAMRNRNLRALQENDFHVPADVPVVIFRVTWTQNDLDFHLVDPGGNTVNKDSMATSPEKYFYRKNLNVPEAYYAIKTPAEGTWKVVIPDVASVGNYQIEVLGANHAPKIGMRNISMNGEIIITWTDKDPDDNAKVSLYYDVDNEGANGTLIVDNLPEDDESDTYTWMPDETVPSGTYYIYAKIDDDANIPHFAYSTETVTVQNRQAPNVPLNFQGNTAGSEIQLEWTSIDGAEGYVVYYTNKPRGKTYEGRLAVGNQTAYTLKDLPTGRVYRLTVTAYDTEGRESNFAIPIEVPLNAVAANNPPQITSSPVTNAKVGTEYSYAVKSVDVDGDRLTYALVTAPDAMQIDPNTGGISWMPSAAQVRNYEVVVKVADDQGGEDEQRFTIIVADQANYLPEAVLIEPTGGESLEGTVTIHWDASDRDDDSLTAALYYSSDGKMYELIAEDLKNTSEYSWDTASVPDGEYRLQLVVKDAESETVDFSESTFKITNSGIPWDLNGDGVVNIFDLVIVGSHFGGSGAGITGDVTGDGVVNIFDLVLVGSHFGETTGLAPVLREGEVASSSVSMPPPIQFSAILDGSLLRIDLHTDTSEIYGLQTDLRYPSGFQPIGVHTSMIQRLTPPDTSSRLSRLPNLVNPLLPTKTESLPSPSEWST